jgi:hypothetical protein
MTEDQYRKLIKSYQPGGTAREKKIVTVFDNDGGYFSCNDPLLNDEQSSEVVRAFEAEIEFSGPDGYLDIVDLANAAGIDAEWC